MSAVFEVKKTPKMECNKDDAKNGRKEISGKRLSRSPEISFEANDDTLRRQHRKLALSLHPDKNNVPFPYGDTIPDLNVKAHDVEACHDETVSMSVPDANFNNFENERVENSFSSDQVWAAYDEDDDMPRYYALIASGFTKTLGNFLVGKSITMNRLNSFSHPVRRWKKGPRGVIQIFPANEDVWAIYKNWSFQWNFDTEKDVLHKYEVAEVLGDYNEDHGVLEEMFRFPHQVPMFKLDGMKDKGAPEGCYELNPAALPSELLQIITEAEVAEETTQRVSKHCGRVRRMDPKVIEDFRKGNGRSKLLKTYFRRKKVMEAQGKKDRISEQSHD
ncbi:uncharacterized protein LOC127240905 [Andrographis paniculata]|uniref:uncharacterized protein LOC127240905 n=1 Tax=Andrographis paniculata TaxID=175694 RepID=UPI0021E74950|nr:uncharacterized protein LOC127240905 [Andrographis paniculata]